MEFCKVTKGLYLTDLEYILLVYSVCSICGMIVKIKKERRKKMLIKKSQESMRVRGGYGDYTNPKLEQFTNLNKSVRKRIKAELVKFITQERKRERLLKLIEQCLDPNKVYLVKDKIIKEATKELVVYGQKEKGKIARVMGIALLRAVVEANLVPILATNFYQIALTRTIKVNALAAGSGLLVFVFASELLPFGLIMVAGTILYYSIFSGTNVNCTRMFRELPGVSPRNQTVFLPKCEDRKGYLIYSGEQPILNYISEDGLFGPVIKAEPKAIVIKQTSEAIKIETLGEEPKPAENVGRPKKKVTKQPKKKKRMKMKTMSDLIKEGNNAQFDIDRNFKPEVVRVREDFGFNSNY